MVPPPLLYAMPALWVGLLYDAGARQAAAELTARWSFSELVRFQGEVARHALRAKGPDGVSALELGRELVGIARKGLAGWRELSGTDESAHLDPLSDILDSGRTLAERVLDAYKASGGDPTSVLSLWRIA
jgi:glutamate--cysteine ligase